MAKFFEISHEMASLATLPVFPLRKLYTEQMFVLLRTERIQLRNHGDAQPVKRSNRAVPSARE